MCFNPSNHLPRLRHSSIRTHYLRFLPGRKRCPRAQNSLLADAAKQCSLNLMTECARRRILD
jgi:hypothetical protein